MKWILIGHRGVGKSSLLRRLQATNALAKSQLDSKIKYIDLDDEIEARTARTVENYFSDKLCGEQSFRAAEKKIFLEVVQENELAKDCFLAVGAGFEVAMLPAQPNWRVVWVQRRSDRKGRIFLNRPRLDSSLEPLDEFLNRKESRDIKFAEVAHELLLLPEGPFGFELQLQKYFENFCRVPGAGLTLLPRHLIDPLRFVADFIELRTDLFDEGFIRIAANKIGKKNRVLISFRRADPTAEFVKWILKNSIAFDWPMELGDPPVEIQRIKDKKNNLVAKKVAPVNRVFSSHDLSVKEFIDLWEMKKRKVQKKSLHWKLSPMVETFSELLQGWEWQRKDPDHRSFLPRSTDGRWRWFRLKMKGRQRLNFFCDGEGSAIDQPAILEWMGMHPQTNHFFAVIGKPVELSWSPAFHQSWSHAQNSDFFAIQVSAEELKTDALPILQKLGCRGLAITSPLKKSIVDYYRNLRPARLSTESDAVNTLYFGSQVAELANTDITGFEALITQIPTPYLDQEIVVWGGGGTLSAIKNKLPQAKFYSAQTGEPRTRKDLAENPAVLIWAGSPQVILQSTPEASSPPAKWKIQIVIDLNYREDSWARAYAQKQAAAYISGETMFVTQALAQQKFWEQHL